jgi:2-octaprenyl-6-methoxyphenol hydroxylase
LSERSNPVFDIIVAGGGVAGMALACCLKEALGAAVKVLVADPKLGEREGRDRALAIAAGSRRLLERIGVWAAIAPSAQPIAEMAIADGGAHDVVRPTQLRFLERGDEPLAHMAMSDDLGAALYGRAVALGVECAKASIIDFKLLR